MSFNSTACTNSFYENMGKSAPQFKQYIDSRFLPELKKLYVKGGPRKAQRKQIIQEAVDALQCYGALDAKDAATKRAHFETSYRAAFPKNGMPPNTPSVSVQIANMKLMEAKYNILLDKFMLLDYWSAVAKGDTEVDWPEDGKHWQTHYLLNYEPTTVRPILQILLNDASDVLNKPVFTATMNAWVGVDSNIVKQFNSTNISKTLKFEASARAGFQGDAKLELEYKGLKGELSAELFAGARTKVGAEVDIRPGKMSVQGNVEVEIGVIINAEAKLNIVDILEIDADVEALAGGQLKAAGKIVVSYDGVEVELSGEAFAGLRIKGSATGKLKLGGREITTVKVEGSAWAGAGASGQVGFKCGVFGNLSFKLKAGAAVGIGAEGGFAVSIDPMNIKYGALNLVWIYASEHGVKNRGKAFLLPVEENVVMCDRARDALFGMMGDLYQQDRAGLDKLKKWELIQSKMIKGRKVGP